MKYIIYCIIILISSWMSLPVQAISRAEAIDQLKSMKAKNSQKIHKTDKQLKENLTKNTSLTLKAENISIMKKTTENISDLRKMRVELIARQNIYDQLIHQVSTHFHGSSHLKDFLPNKLAQMAYDQAVNSNSKTQSTWKFLSYLSVAVKNLPERSESILDFIQSYIQYSGVINPKDSMDFIDKRHYTNGLENQSASMIPKDQIGDVVEQKLKILEKQKTENQSSKAFTLPQPALKTPLQRIKIKLTPIKK